MILTKSIWKIIFSYLSISDRLNVLSINSEYRNNLFHLYIFKITLNNVVRREYTREFAQRISICESFYLPNSKWFKNITTLYLDHTFSNKIFEKTLSFPHLQRLYINKITKLTINWAFFPLSLAGIFINCYERLRFCGETRIFYNITTVEMRASKIENLIVGIFPNCVEKRMEIIDNTCLFPSWLYSLRDKPRNNKRVSEQSTIYLGSGIENNKMKRIYVPNNGYLDSSFDSAIEITAYCCRNFTCFAPNLTKLTISGSADLNLLNYPNCLDVTLWLNYSGNITFPKYLGKLTLRLEESIKLPDKLRIETLVYSVDLENELVLPRDISVLIVNCSVLKIENIPKRNNIIKLILFKKTALVDHLYRFGKLENLSLRYDVFWEVDKNHIKRVRHITLLPFSHNFNFNLYNFSIETIDFPNFIILDLSSARINDMDTLNRLLKLLIERNCILVVPKCDISSNCKRILKDIGNKVKIHVKDNYVL